jgi:hypothetical protein
MDPGLCRDDDLGCGIETTNGDVFVETPISGASGAQKNGGQASAVSNS